MKKKINWMKDNLVLMLVIISILFAFIIHCLFSETAPNAWVAAKWSAGDILTYVSTVALGLLAVWQNQKFKEENDELQIRMEKLTTQANELTVINKIIEHESERVSSLKIKVQSYIDACNTEGIYDDLSDMANQPRDFVNLYVNMKMDSRNQKIKLCTIDLLSEFKIYPNDSKTRELIDCISKYSKLSMTLVEGMSMHSSCKEAQEEKKDAEKEFLTRAYDFMSEREALLNKVIYGDLSLVQIKAMYHKEGQSNGQNENGVD